jgi:hypothetical protein
MIRTVELDRAALSINSRTRRIACERPRNNIGRKHQSLSATASATSSSRESLTLPHDVNQITNCPTAQIVSISETSNRLNQSPPCSRAGARARVKAPDQQCSGRKEEADSRRQARKIANMGKGRNTKSGEPSQLDPYAARATNKIRLLCHSGQ